jgi:hypothetical protein
LIFVNCNTLKLQALKFYFCAFCVFLRLYQFSTDKSHHGRWERLSSRELLT